MSLVQRKKTGCSRNRPEGTAGGFLHLAWPLAGQSFWWILQIDGASKFHFDPQPVPGLSSRSLPLSGWSSCAMCLQDFLPAYGGAPLPKVSMQGKISQVLVVSCVCGPPFRTLAGAQMPLRSSLHVAGRHKSPLRGRHGGWQPSLLPAPGCSPSTAADAGSRAKTAHHLFGGGENPLAMPAHIGWAPRPAIQGEQTPAAHVSGAAAGGKGWCLFLKKQVAPKAPGGLSGTRVSKVAGQSRESADSGCSPNP